ncbi:MAG: 3-hydroxyacyl-CoA dehydrogenase [Bacteroidetes bacterium]|nr:3-hydroxyacyl-CoA dehydrogenase [Bacteroidota bacterium]
MNIALTGPTNRKEEWKSKVASSCNILEFDFGKEVPAHDVLVDLNFDDHPERILAYAQLESPLILSCVKIQLLGVLAHFGIHHKKNVFGINAIPTFIHRELNEMSIAFESERSLGDKLCEEIGIKPDWVQDRVGLVTARVLFMIINEAYYTVQEGTAGKSDIDTGMKLGTAYPNGPFEWLEKIGIRDVYEVLDSLYQDTREERYKVCSLLKTEYLQSVL